MLKFGLDLGMIQKVHKYFANLNFVAIFQDVKVKEFFNIFTTLCV